MRLKTYVEYNNVKKKPQIFFSNLNYLYIYRVYIVLLLKFIKSGLLYITVHSILEENYLSSQNIERFCSVH